MRTVAALYIDPRGPYPSMECVDCWDEKRDAKLYDGPHPVVAHPPCGPWSKLRGMCTKQDPECGPRAVEQVRAHGGILEHPEHSALWARCRLPLPGELPDEHGGYTVRVEQGRWGHECAKPTWLYCIGIKRFDFGRLVRFRGKSVEMASHLRRRLTPPAFAEWLVSLSRASSAPPRLDAAARGVTA